LNETIHVYVTVPLPPRVAGSVSVAAVGVCPWSINAVETVGALAVASAVLTVTAPLAVDVVVTDVVAESFSCISYV
jgi:carbohydrate-binding DOMON domain-containing protein